MTQLLDALVSRLADKRAALDKSDAAMNTLTDLIVAAANGEAVTENGTRLSMAEVAKGADALRQVHAALSSEVDAIEQRIGREKKRIASDERKAEFTQSRLSQLLTARPRSA